MVFIPIYPSLSFIYFAVYYFICDICIFLEGLTKCFGKSAHLTGTIDKVKKRQIDYFESMSGACVGFKVILSLCGSLITNMKVRHLRWWFASLLSHTSCMYQLWKSTIHFTIKDMYSEFIIIIIINLFCTIQSWWIYGLWKFIWFILTFLSLRKPLSDFCSGSVPLQVG